MINTIQYINNAVRIIDQTKLPSKLVYLDCKNIKTLWNAIKALKVRGAPALGAAAAFGVLLGLKDFKVNDRAKFVKKLNHVCDYIASSRPTAVNLFHALNDMKMVVQLYPNTSVSNVKQLLKKKAMEIFETDRLVCRKMGSFGAKLIKSGDNVMTICNAGALATVDYGTALGVFYAAKEAKKKFKVFACETRPLLQGSRLTAWELKQNKIDTTLITDNMAAVTMRDKNIKAIFTGADRIAANGDSANKIGTYGLAVLAKYHKIPFYIVAPKSTFDFSLKSGQKIPIEERSGDEVRYFQGQQSAPEKVDVFNPAFDVTPNKLITGIVTEYGVIAKPYNKNIKKVLKDQGVRIKS